jgi:DNA-directed RNA polymerase subunit beta'
MTVKAVIEGGEVIETLADRILGRCSAVDLLDPISGKVVAKAGELLDETLVDAIDTAGIEVVLIRSVLTCKVKVGVCRHCYGRDLSRGTMVNIGEAVGIIAAQSIGEPGTQLTMRTFHIGGAAQSGAKQSNIEANVDAKVEVRNRNVVIDSNNIPIVMARNTEVALIDEQGRERANYRVPYGAKLLADEGVQVKKGDRLAEWDPYTLPIITEREGTANYVDLVDGVSMRDRLEANHQGSGFASAHHAPRRQG